MTPEGLFISALHKLIRRLVAPQHSRLNIPSQKLITIFKMPQGALKKQNSSAKSKSGRYVLLFFLVDFFFKRKILMNILDRGCESEVREKSQRKLSVGNLKALDVWDFFFVFCFGFVN